MPHTSTIAYKYRIEVLFPFLPSLPFSSTPAQDPLTLLNIAFNILALYLRYSYLTISHHN